MIVTQIAAELFQLLDSLYKALIGILWAICVKYGLSPRYAFLVPFISSGPYHSLESSLFVDIYFRFSVIILLLATVFTLFYNSYGKATPLSPVLFKFLAAFFLGTVTFLAIGLVLSLLSSAYSSVYESAGISWSNFLLFSTQLGSGHLNGSGGLESIIIQVFTLSGYFLAAVTLFATLMLRQALMLFAILILPFATVLMAFNPGARFGRVVWEIIIEMSAYPFFVLASLYLAHIFQWDAPLQLAFLFLPSLLPGMLFASGKGFASAPMMGFLGELSLSGAASRGFQAMEIGSSFIRGGSFAGSLKSGLEMPLQEHGHRQQAPAVPGKGQDMPWKDLINDELKYRKV